jgi:hypothetical protein
MCIMTRRVRERTRQQCCIGLHGHERHLHIHSHFPNVYTNNAAHRHQDCDRFLPIFGQFRMYNNHENETPRLPPVVLSHHDVCSLHIVKAKALQSLHMSLSMPFCTSHAQNHIKFFVNRNENENSTYLCLPFASDLESKIKYFEKRVERTHPTDMFGECFSSAHRKDKSMTSNSHFFRTNQTSSIRR